MVGAADDFAQGAGTGWGELALLDEGGEEFGDGVRCASGDGVARAFDDFVEAGSDRGVADAVARGEPLEGGRLEDELGDEVEVLHRELGEGVSRER